MISKALSVIKISLISIVILCGWNYFTDWYLSKIKNPVATYDLNLKEYVDQEQLLQEIAKRLRPQLDSQILIASPQRISAPSILQLLFNISNETASLFKYFQVNFDLLNYFYRRFNNKTPYGGFILYDYNIGNYTLEQYAAYTSYLKNIYKIKIRINFINKTHTPINVTIYPWVVADCSLALTEKPYCRNFKTKEIVKKVAVEELYSKIGLDSPLAPNIDDFDVEKFCSNANPILQNLVKNMYYYNQLPVLKHFLYNASATDTHDNSYIDFRSLKDIQKDSGCYKAIDELNIPFAIMPSHFYLNAIDKNNILTKSDKFQRYITKTFKNAYTISDEISMKGYSKSLNFSKRVSLNSSDLILVHGGTVKFWKRIQLQHGVKQINHEVIIKKIKRGLELKKKYGLLKFQNITNTQTNLGNSSQINLD